uniref:Cnidarian restricted protein n=1 Tax=Clytia hemisphaerica TaxID=252671 RepID=A0A7M5USD6_9CNID
MIKICTLAIIVVFTCQANAKNEILGIPPNNHGIEPQITKLEAFKPSDVGLIGNIGRLSTEWSLSFDFICREYPDNWYSLLVATTGATHHRFGGRVPRIYLHLKKIWIFSHLGSSTNYGIIKYDVNLNQIYSFEINHRYVANGEYRYTFIVNGVEISSIPNTPGRQIHNVNLFGGAGGPDLDVELSNVKHTNFL